MGSGRKEGRKGEAVAAAAAIYPAFFSKGPALTDCLISLAFIAPLQTKEKRERPK